MLPFSPLAILPLLISTPEWPLHSPQFAELGGTVVERASGLPFPSPVPVTVNLYSGQKLIASTPVDLSGRYVIASPPGDYWLQIQFGGEESAERILLRAGSWQRDFEVSRVSSTPVKWAVAEGLRRAELRATAAGTDVAYERMSVPAASVSHDVPTAIEMLRPRAFQSRSLRCTRQGEGRHEQASAI